MRIINDFDKYLFHEGKHHNCYKFLGAHIREENGIKGVRFTTWAPNASNITIVGDFSNWQCLKENEMKKVDSDGLWTAFIGNICEDTLYKFAITDASGTSTTLKSDPFAFKSELRPATASIVINEDAYKWHDSKWIENRKHWSYNESPINIYELHLASWKRNNNEFLSYYEITEILPNYLKTMGYTHVEFMPLHEHPLDESWGYQSTGYYSPTSRHGDYTGLKVLIDELHKNNIGVILDWVGGHFCRDEHGLERYDGSPTFEYNDYWKANNEGWGALNFDLGKNEVKSFLISNAFYWINEFHFDGLRVDAVSNMLYLNYDRYDGEWIPNIYGGYGNLEAINFLKEFNDTIHCYFPGVLTIAEESSSWPKITHDTKHDGLGFSFKWNMGCMNDTLKYVEIDPFFRKYHHNNITFSMEYHYGENYILPISHDEVVHGKKSLVNKMHGDLWRKYAGLRLYAGFMIGHPGKKLLFMGSEFAQFIEWRDNEQLQWEIIDKYPIHRMTQHYFKNLNHLYKNNSALWQLDNQPSGFQWIEKHNSLNSIVSFIRKGKNEKDFLIFICNFTPEVHYDYKVGVPYEGEYIEMFNSDELEFGGSGQIVCEKLYSSKNGVNNMPYSITTKIPPLAISIYKIIENN